MSEAANTAAMNSAAACHRSTQICSSPFNLLQAMLPCGVLHPPYNHMHETAVAACAKQEHYHDTLLLLHCAIPLR